jgi:glycosyltransferase domain-containing protein
LTPTGQHCKIEHMSSASRARHTLIIPTYNRPACLRSLLGYLAARRFNYPILVLDSSFEQALAENRETIAGAGLSVTHQVHDPAIAVIEKFSRGAQAVETPYCSFCADDDILLTCDLDPFFRFLDANPTFVAAHGCYVNFKPGHDFHLSYTMYSAPSIAADDGLQRIVVQMRNYQAIFYAIHRSEVMQAVLRQLTRVPSGMAQELLASSLTLIAGGVHRTHDFFMARNTSPSISSKGGHPHQFLATDPMSLFAEYATYRAVVLEHLAADARCRERYTPAQMERVLDLAHLMYLAPMISGPVLDYVIEQSLRPDGRSDEIVAGVWSRFVNPGAAALDQLTGVRSQLRRALADPRRLGILMGYAGRLLRLGGALRFREGVEVAVDRRPGDLRIRRRARDGRPRDYVLARELLHQDLGGGRRISASAIRTMVEQLDDYV